MYYGIFSWTKKENPHVLYLRPFQSAPSKLQFNPILTLKDIIYQLEIKKYKNYNIQINKYNMNNFQKIT